MRISTILSIVALAAATSAAPADSVAPGEPTPGTPDVSGTITLDDPIPPTGTITLDDPTSELPGGTISLDDPAPPTGTITLDDPTSSGTVPSVSITVNATLPTLSVSTFPTPNPPSTFYPNTTTTVTGSATVTDFVTFCPYPTTVTVTTCRSNVCLPHTVTVPEATTLTVTGSCLVPTTYTTETCHECTKTQEPTTTPGPSSVPSVPTVSEGSAPKNIAGALAGIMAIAAVLF
ncbi:unnamed protein product [Debaryomyces tyrocola]|nr:unnamed protein product [Debaryomyces tyrocola]